MSLSFDQIISASPLPNGELKTIAVNVPHWGGDVTLRKMNAAEFITFNTHLEPHADASGNITDRTQIGAGMLFMVVSTALDDKGAKLFDTPAKVQKLNSDWEALSILGAAALSFNNREAPAPKNEPSNPSPSSA